MGMSTRESRPPCARGRGEGRGRGGGGAGSQAMADSVTSLIVLFSCSYYLVSFLIFP